MDVTVSQYRFYYRSLALKMFFAMVVASALPLIVMAGAARHYFLSSFTDEVQSHFSAVLGQGQARIEGFLLERIDGLKLLGRTRSPQGLSDQAVLRECLASLEAVYGPEMVALVLLDAQGKRMAYAGPDDLPSFDDAALQSIPHRVGTGTYVGDITEDPADRGYFIIAVGSSSGQGGTVLSAVVSAQPLQRLLADATSGGTTKGFILNGTGRAAVLLPSEDADVSEVSQITGLTSSTSEQGVTVREHGDRSILLGRAPIAHSPWTLVFTQDSSLAFRALFEARRSAVAIVVLGILGLVVAGAFVSSRLAHHVAHMDQERQLLNEQLSRTSRLASLGEMAAGIAHEINNPLAIVAQEAGWMKDLMDEGPEKLPENMEELSKAVGRIEAHAKRCRDITHRMLSFARPVSAGLEPVQLNALIGEVAELYWQRARSNRVTIVAQLQPDLPLVLVSPTQLEQVLMNLIGNSLDAMEKTGGTVTITSGLQGTQVFVDVADTGPGIPLQYLARIFDPFFTTKPVGKGTGLGLSICHTIMKSMNADITVTSEEDRGTTFHLLFPLPPEPAQKPDALESSPKTGETVP